MDEEHERDLAEARGRVSRIVLQRYRLDSLQGVGGVAAVYAATDLATSGLVAVKLLHPSHARDRTGSARFARESRVTRWLEHPAIPRWIATGHDPVCGLALVMEFVDGVDLGAVLARHGRLPLVESLRLTARAADALESAHASGIVHRDVKPENLVLWGGALQPEALRLVDFGLAFCVDATRLTQMHTIEGSPCFLAPEQIQGGAVTPATDVYALGATLVTMLTGAPPFDGGYLEQLTAHMTQAPPSLRKRRSEVPEVVERFVLRMLEKEPRRRPSSAAEVSARLTDFAGWFANPQPPEEPAASAVIANETASELIDEIQRLTDRLYTARATAAAAHGRIIEQLVEITARQFSGVGDPARDAAREAALEAALQRMEVQSRAEQVRLLATLRGLEERLLALR